MKKTYRLFGMMCLAGAMIMATSCGKKPTEKATATIGLPEEFEEVVGEPNEAERAYIDFNNGNMFKWNANDEVMVYNIDAAHGENSEVAIYKTDASAEGKTVATFTKYQGDDFTAKKDHYFVFYPASKVMNNNFSLNSDNFETFSVAEFQDYTLINGKPAVDPTSLASACEISTLDEQFRLKHIFGIFRIKLKGTQAVDHIKLIDNSINLHGTVQMKLHIVNMNTFSSLMDSYTLVSDGQVDLNPAFVSAWNTYRQQLGYTTQPAGKSITLNCPTGGVQLNATTATPFYFGVRPGAFIKGFTVEVYFTDNTKATITNYSNPKTSYRIKAGTITGFSPAQVLVGE